MCGLNPGYCTCTTCLGILQLWGWGMETKEMKNMRDPSLITGVLASLILLGSTALATQESAAACKCTDDNCNSTIQCGAKETCSCCSKLGSGTWECKCCTDTFDCVNVRDWTCRD